MKLHKLIVLTVVLLLPAQVLLADNVKGHYQYGVAGSVKKAPVKTTNKLKMVAPIRRGVVVANPVANSGPSIATQKLTAPNRKLKIVRPKPRGANLTVAIRYERDVCTVDESFVGKNIYDARCDIIVTVKNTGGTATAMGANGGFKLVLWYTNYKGELKEWFKYIGNLGVNEQKIIRYRHQSIRSFKRSTPLTVDVDRSFLIPETNEHDNSAVLWLN